MYVVSRYMVYFLCKLTAYIEVYLYLSLLIYEIYNFVTGRNYGGHIVYYAYQTILNFSTRLMSLI
jgi:hypothetical protein